MLFFCQSRSAFTLFLLLQMSINGTAFIIFCPGSGTHRFAKKTDFGTTLQFSRHSLSKVYLIPPKSRSVGERRSCSRAEVMKDDYSDPALFGAETNDELDNQPSREWNFIGRTITRLSNVFDTVLRFVRTSFHRLLVVRFIWLMQTTASLKSVLLDSTRSFSSSRPQVQQLLRIRCF